MLSNILGGEKDTITENNIKTNFKDVIGIDEFKDELLDLVDYLKNP